MILLIALAALLTSLNFFDWLATTLVIKKGRGSEAWGPTKWLMDRIGSWWWISKIPVVAYAWFAAFSGETVTATVMLLILNAIFIYVVQNNYRVLWRQI